MKHYLREVAPRGMPLLVTAEVCESTGVIPKSIRAYPIEGDIVLEECMTFTAQQQKWITLRLNAIINKWT